MSIASTLLGTAAAVTLLVASAARPVSANDCALHGTCCFGPKPVAMQWKPSSIEMVFEKLIVSEGGLNRLEVRRALVTHAAAVEACFERSSAVGIAVDSVVVIAHPGVSNRAASKATDPTLARCVSAALARIRFSQPNDFAVTTISVRIHARRL